METNKKTEYMKQTADIQSVSRRKYEIEGKRFIVTRHFEGDKDLNSLIMEIAVRKTNREMGL